MMKFEYKILEVPVSSGFWTGAGKIDFQELCNKLNELGREGWEIVSSTDLNRYQGQSNKVLIIMKRTINEN